MHHWIPDFNEWRSVFSEIYYTSHVRLLYICKQVYRFQLLFMDCIPNFH